MVVQTVDKTNTEHQYSRHGDFSQHSLYQGYNNISNWPSDEHEVNATYSSYICLFVYIFITSWFLNIR